MKNLSISLFMLVFSISSYASDWEWLNPKPNGNGFIDMSFPTKNIGYGVGDCKTISKTIDGGKTWKLYSVSKEKSWIMSVYFTNENIGYIATFAGSIYKTEDGGKLWKKLDSNCDRILLKIFFSSASTGYACGYNGTILKTIDAGNTWSKLQSGTTSALQRIQFMDDNNGFVYSGDDVMYKTKDGGKTWGKYSSPNYVYKKVDFLTVDTGFVLASNNVLLKTVDNASTWTKLTTPDNSIDIKFINNNIGFIATSTMQIHKTTDGGVHWSKIFQDTLVKFTLNLNLCVFDENNVYVSTEEGFFMKLANNGDSWCKYSSADNFIFNTIASSNKMTLYGASLGQNGIIKSTDGGLSWSQLTDSKIKSGYFSKIYFNENKIGFGLGLSSFYKTNNEGKTWTTQKLPVELIDGANLNNIYFSTNSKGIAIGRNGVIIQTLDTGNTWLNVNSNTTKDLSGITMIDLSTGFVVGSGGTILKTINGGTTWQKINSPSSDYLTCITTINSKTLMVVGLNGIILKSIDGGNSWVKKQSGVIIQLNSVKFISSKIGYIAGNNGLILMTKDGGETWKSIYTGSLKNMNDLLMIDSNNVYAAGVEGVFKNSDFEYLSKNNNTATLLDIKMFDKNNGIAVGQIGNILVTHTNGLNWSFVSIMNENINSLKIINSNTAICVGDKGAIFKSVDSGDSWKQMNFTDKTQSLRDVYVLNKNIFFSISLNGNVYKSIDAGLNWIKINSKSIPISYSIYFMDEQVGYAAGGLIYKTIDGGITWNYNSTGMSNDKKFIFFMDSLNGFAGQYKTIDGGINWSNMSDLNSNVNKIFFINDTLGYAVSEDGYIHKSFDKGKTWIEDSTISCYDFKSIHTANSGELFVCGDGGLIMKTKTGITQKTDTTTTANLTEKALVNQWNLYPNPVDAEITIINNAFNKNSTSCIIYDLQGKEVKVDTLNNPENILHVSELNNGLYVLKLKSLENEKIYKILINH